MAKETVKHFNFNDEKTIEAPPTDTGEGFSQVDDLGRWPKLYEGMIVQGILLRRVEVVNKINPDAERFVYQIRLTRLLKAMASSRNEAGEVVQQETVFKPGDVVNLDERSKLNGLRTVVDSDHVFEVWIKVIKKQPIQNGMKAWLIDVRQQVKGLKDPADPSFLNTSREDNGGEGDDKIPF
jgi:hypothetical protein